MSDTRVSSVERGPRGPRGHEGPRGPTGSAGDQPIIASAFADGVNGVFFTSKGFGAFTKNSTGNYTLPLAGSPPPDINCVVNVTLSTEFANAANVVVGVASGKVNVLVFSPPGTPADSRFYVTVVNDS